jgi:hypothetical protein
VLSSAASKLRFNPFTARLGKQEIIKLFLVVCVPVHFWAIFMALQDLEWIVGRTMFWDFLGYSAYVLLIAFIESILITLGFLLFSLLLPSSWKQKINLSILSIWALAILFAAILYQYYYFLNINQKTSNPYLLRFFDYVNYYDIWLFIFLMLSIVLSAVLPVILFPRFVKITSLMLDLIDRLNLLAAFFLFFDAAGLLIILYRNLANFILL